MPTVLRSRAVVASGNGRWGRGSAAFRPGFRRHLVKPARLMRYVPSCCKGRDVPDLDSLSLVELIVGRSVVRMSRRVGARRSGADFRIAGGGGAYGLPLPDASPDGPAHRVGRRSLCRRRRDAGAGGRTDRRAAFTGRCRPAPPGAADVPGRGDRATVRRWPASRACTLPPMVRDGVRRDVRGSSYVHRRCARVLFGGGTSGGAGAPAAVAGGRAVRSAPGTDMT